MNIKMRQRVERSIIRRLVLDSIRDGYTISVYDGEELTVKQSTSVKEIMGAVMTTDEDWLLFSRPGDEPAKQLPNAWRASFNTTQGWVRLVYGNDGWDVVCDYTTNLEHVMSGANELANRYGDQS